MSLNLFNREWQLVVDNLDISGLDFQFQVGKDNKSDPNKLELKIFNLSPDHVAELSKRAKAKETTGITVELSAGYVGNAQLIFRGDAREISTVNTSPDRITTIAAHDGGKSFREGRVNLSMGPNSSVSNLLIACAKAMGVGIGNALEIAASAKVDGLGGRYPRGGVISGPASRELDRLTRSARLTWSIQNGLLQLQQQGVPLQTTAIRIASDTGMVGSPWVEIDTSVAVGKKESGKAAKKKKALFVNVKTLIIPGIYPGRKVTLDAAQFDGGYEVAQCVYSGDTVGNDWNITSKLRPYT